VHRTTCYKEVSSKKSFSPMREELMQSH